MSQWSHTENIWKWTGSTTVILITKTKIYTKTNVSWEVVHVEGLVQDCNISLANALELLQSCAKPSICLVCSVFHLWFEKLRYSSGNHIQSICKIWSRTLFSVHCVSETTTEVFGTFYNLWPSYQPELELHWSLILLPSMGMGSKGNSRNVLDCAGMRSLRSDRCIASSSLWASGTMTSWDDVLVSFLRASLMALIHTAAFFLLTFSLLPTNFTFLLLKTIVYDTVCTHVVVLWSYTGWRSQLLHCSTPNTHHKRWWL